MRAEAGHLALLGALRQRGQSERRSGMHLVRFRHHADTIQRLYTS